jgi:hypothetical protein
LTKAASGFQESKNPTLDKEDTEDQEKLGKKADKCQDFIHLSFACSKNKAIS